jgi:4-amino-4-deoxy-L-arabinose transferase-like glycosyltransferase
VVKPTLLPWLIAAIAWAAGQVDEWTTRLPAMLAVLATALMVLGLTRRHASRWASLFATGCFMFCPLVLKKLTIAEPDTLVTALSFGAFLVWWRGIEIGRPTLWRWLACGVLLALLALCKGPQPAAFFALGAGAITIIQRRWRDLPGLMLCFAIPAIAILGWGWATYQQGDITLWLDQMRMRDATGIYDTAGYFRERAKFAVGLPFELLPGTLLLFWLPELWRRERRSGGPPLIGALVAYASLATLALLVWRNGATRYVMPAAPALAVFAGLAFDEMQRARPQLARLAAAAVASLAAYQAILVIVVMPIFADRFGAGRLAGLAIGNAALSSGAPPLATDLDTNQLFYLPFPLDHLAPENPADLPVPVTLLGARDRLQRIAAARPDLSFKILVETKAGPGLLAARVDRAKP